MSTKRWVIKIEGKPKQNITVEYNHEKDKIYFLGKYKTVYHDTFIVRKEPYDIIENEEKLLDVINIVCEQLDNAVKKYKKINEVMSTIKEVKYNENY